MILSFPLVTVKSFFGLSQMANLLVAQGQKTALLIVATQASVVTLASMVALFWGIDVAYSVLIGGLIHVLPSLYFAIKVFKHAGAQAARQVVRAFYLGETLKIVFTIGLFIVVFMWIPVVVSACLVGYVLSVLMQMTTPFVVKTA